MEDKQLVAELRKKYIENPPEGMTPELVKNMSNSDLLDMSYFLSEGDYDDEYDDKTFSFFNILILFPMPFHFRYGIFSVLLNNELSYKVKKDTS